jgi:hypothetical protein
MVITASYLGGHVFNSRRRILCPSLLWLVCLAEHRYHLYGKCDGCNCLRILLAQVTMAFASGCVNGNIVVDGDVSRGAGDVLFRKK